MFIPLWILFLILIVTAILSFGLFLKKEHNAKEIYQSYLNYKYFYNVPPGMSHPSRDLTGCLDFESWIKREIAEKRL